MEWREAEEGRKEYLGERTVGVVNYELVGLWTVEGWKDREGTLPGFPPKIRVTSGLSCSISGRYGREVAIIESLDLNGRLRNFRFRYSMNVLKGMGLG